MRLRDHQQRTSQKKTPAEACDLDRGEIPVFHDQAEKDVRALYIQISQADLKAAVNFIRFRHDGTEKIATGREAWALSELISAGLDGCTPITHVGPRWSEYARRLRGRGINIETVNEMHAGPFAGRHGRYVLRSPIEVLEIKTASAGNVEAA